MSDQTEPNPDALDTLAAEYALGVIEGADFDAARRRYDSVPAFRAAVHDWQEHISGLALELPAREPPAAVLNAIISRMDAVAPGPLAFQPSLWTSLKLWRGLTAAGVMASAALGAALMLGAPVTAPIPIAGSPETGPSQGQSFSAALAGREGAVLFYAATDPTHAGLLVIPAADARGLAGTLHFWLSRGDDEPRSLGAADAREARYLPLTTELAALIDRGAIVVVTMETSAARPNAGAMGPVIAKGALSPIQRAHQLMP
ncbi:MAG: anti-sigma factor [Sandarakinorhabdus sp.]